MKRLLPSFHFSRKVITLVSLLIVFVVSAVLVLAIQHQQNARSRADHELTGTVTITGIAVNNSSAKISFLPVANAVDYRAYDVNNPALMKYAGKLYLENGTTSAGQIEWNLLGDGQNHTIVVEAVDALGPVPRANQYDLNNRPLVNPVPNDAMPGANAGPTTDGNFSINGQGASGNNPHVIARSPRFVVRANPALRAIPSGQDAGQAFFDMFPNDMAPSIQRVGEIDAVNSVVTYRLGTAPTDWTILFSGVDTGNSMPFIADDHFMEMVFDGGTPLHTAFGYMTMTPRPQLDFSNGRIAHLTMEVDSHFTDNRWVGIELAPATDPFRSLNPAQPVNTTNRGIFVEILNNCVVDFAAGLDNNGNPVRTRLMGGNSAIPCNRRQNGIGLDNRTRFDLFVSQNRIALFENGVLLSQGAIPPGLLNFQLAQAYFSHYNIESTLGREVLQQAAPYMDYWINQFPYSDERHWDNMGFEVLPGVVGDDWSVLGSRIQMPQSVPLPTVVPSVQPTVIPSPSVVPTSLPTLIPTTTGQPSVFPTLLPTIVTPILSPTPLAGTGLQGRYVLRINKGQSPILNRIDPVIDFRPGQHIHNGSSLPDNTINARWNGFIMPQESGEYTFIVRSNGITRLLIDNKIITSPDKKTPKIFGDLPYTKNINRFLKKGINGELTGKITLTAGKKHSIFLNYIKIAKEGSITLLWKTPSGSQQVIPQAQLYPR
ncbi:MAG TPA: PA14 domain-containing protein [Xanthomonadales bacterium]|nr:PA14 domain-containing protein [Xanthomonadales bacterium]